MPKVNPEPVRKNRISCTCARKSGDDENSKTFEDCECGMVGQRDSGKRFRIKSVAVKPLAEENLESFLLGELF